MSNIAKRFPRLALKLQATDGIQEGQKRQMPIGIQEKGVYTLPDSHQRVIPGVASADSKDRVDEIIKPDGLILDEIEKNNILLFGHDHDKMIGTVLELKKEKKRLTFKGVETEMNKSDMPGDPFAKFIFDKYFYKELHMFSIGFIPVKWIFYNAAGEQVERWWDADYLEYLEAELLEISCVTIGCNRDALTLALAEKAFGKKDTAAPFSPPVIQPNSDALIHLFADQQLKSLVDRIQSEGLTDSQSETLNGALGAFNKALGNPLSGSDTNNKEAAQELQDKLDKLSSELDEQKTANQSLLTEKAQLTTDKDALLAEMLKMQGVMMKKIAQNHGNAQTH